MAEYTLQVYPLTTEDRRAAELAGSEGTLQFFCDGSQTTRFFEKALQQKFQFPVELESTCKGTVADVAKEKGGKLAIGWRRAGKENHVTRAAAFTQFFQQKENCPERSTKVAKRSLPQAPRTKTICSDTRIAIPATVFADDECFTCADPGLFSPPRHTFIFDDDSLLGGAC
jgi:hypothetical protein